MRVGSVVTLKVEGMLGNPAGTRGVAYEEYNIGAEHPGLSFIFANGHYDGFSTEEQQAFLWEFGFDESVAGYQFRNVMQLSADFEKGVFDSCLKIDRFAWKDIAGETKEEEFGVRGGL
jgi:hypothetical protein